MGIFVVMPFSTAFSETLQLPDFGDSSSRTISKSEEVKLGKLIIRQLHREMNFIDDADITGYVSDLGYQLVSHLEEKNNQYQFFVVQNNTINAFALPGGFIVVHSGLITKTDSESEMAAVLAHEISHVSQNHIAQAMARSHVTGLMNIAGVLLAVIAGSQNPEIGQAALYSTIAAGAQDQLDYSRVNEKEADRVGIDLLYHSGYDPNSMSKFFNKLLQESRTFGMEVPEFLRTHPVTESRIADARNRAEQFKVNKIRATRLPYFLIKAKLKVLTGDMHYDMDFFRKQLSNAISIQQKAGARFGIALALQKEHHTIKAIDHMQQLLKEDPDRLEYLVTTADMHMEIGHNDAALTLYEKAIALNPKNVYAVRQYATALLSLHQNKQAISLLRNQIQSMTDDASPVFYHLLSRAYGANDDLINAYISNAQYYFLIGQAETAISQLETAKKLPKLTEFHRLRIDDRLKQYKAIALEESKIKDVK